MFAANDDASLVGIFLLRTDLSEIIGVGDIFAAVGGDVLVLDDE